MNFDDEKYSLWQQYQVKLKEIEEKQKQQEEEEKKKRDERKKKDLYRIIMEEDEAADEILNSLESLSVDDQDEELQRLLEMPEISFKVHERRRQKLKDHLEKQKEKVEIKKRALQLKRERICEQLQQEKRAAAQKKAEKEAKEKEEKEKAELIKKKMEEQTRLEAAQNRYFKKVQAAEKFVKEFEDRIYEERRQRAVAFYTLIVDKEKEEAEKQREEDKNIADVRRRANTARKRASDTFLQEQNNPHALDTEANPETQMHFVFSDLKRAEHWEMQKKQWKK